MRDYTIISKKLGYNDRLKTRAAIIGFKRRAKFSSTEQTNVSETHMRDYTLISSKLWYNE